MQYLHAKQTGRHCHQQMYQSSCSRTCRYHAYQIKAPICTSRASIVPGKLCNCRPLSKSACKSLVTEVWPADDCLTRFMHQAVEHLFTHCAYRLCSMSTTTYRDSLHMHHMAMHSDTNMQDCNNTMCSVCDTVGKGSTQTCKLYIP